MERFGFHQNRIVRIATFALSAFLISSPVVAQDAGEAGCSTTKDCAQEIVEIANELVEANRLLTERVAELEDELRTVTAQLRTERDNALNAIRTKDQIHIVNNGGNGQSELCPVGFYMVGARWTVTSGGAHGIMSWLGPVCRRI